MNGLTLGHRRNVPEGPDRTGKLNSAENITSRSMGAQERIVGGGGAISAALNKLPPLRHLEPDGPENRKRPAAPVCGNLWRICSMNLSKCVDGTERRGNVCYLRWRVPAEFRDVEPRTEINQSLKTNNEAEARAVALLKKKAIRKVWKDRLLKENQNSSFVRSMPGWSPSPCLRGKRAHVSRSGTSLTRNSKPKDIVSSKPFQSISKRSGLLRRKEEGSSPDPEKLEGAYERILEILRARPEDGRKLVPIAQRLERELHAIRDEEDDHERTMRMEA